MSIIEFFRDIWMSNACVKFEERSLYPSKVIALTTKLCGRGGRGGCVAEYFLIVVCLFCLLPISTPHGSQRSTPRRLLPIPKRTPPSLAKYGYDNILGSNAAEDAAGVSKVKATDDRKANEKKNKAPSYVTTRRTPLKNTGFVYL